MADSSFTVSIVFEHLSRDPGELMIRSGVGGGTFQPWRGVSYPPGAPQAKELDDASRKQTAIEVKGADYPAFKPKTFATWGGATPDERPWR